MPRITLEQVQSWLANQKLDVSEYDSELEETAWSTVSSRLKSDYDISGWADETDTPRLIRDVIAMMVAGWTFNRQYPQRTGETGQSYGDKLLMYANALVDGLVEGLYELDESPLDVGKPAFFPNDTATLIAEEEGADAPGAASQAFTMGRVW